MRCELCSEQEGEMDFNCVLPSFNTVVEGDICFTCFGIAENDMDIATDLIKRRAEQAMIPLPTTVERMLTLTKRRT